MTTTDTANAPTLLERAKALLNNDTARVSAAIVPLALAQHARGATVFTAATDLQVTSATSTNAGTNASEVYNAGRSVRLTGSLTEIAKQITLNGSGGGTFSLPYTFLWGKADANDVGAPLSMSPSATGDHIRVDYAFSIDYSDPSDVIPDRDSVVFQWSLTVGFADANEDPLDPTDDYQIWEFSPLFAGFGPQDGSFQINLDPGTAFSTWFVRFEISQGVGDFVVPDGKQQPSLTVSIPNQSIDLTYVSGTVGIPDPDHVTVPMPTASWMGFATLVGLAGTDFFRRQRSAGK